MLKITQLIKKYGIKFGLCYIFIYLCDVVKAL